jgi:glycosyltransferase involved in cell wall biosynthesis
LNILMVTLAYPPAFAFGGPVKVVQNNARELIKRGHQVTVCCTNRLDKENKLGPGTIEKDDQGVRVVYHDTHFLGTWNGNFGPSLSPGLLAYLSREGRNFDLIHLNEARTFASMTAGLYALSRRIPYIIQAHGSFAPGWRYQRAKRLYDVLAGRRLYRGAARVIALQKEEIAECEAVGIAPKKIVVLGNGLNLSSFHPDPEAGREFRKQWGIPATASVVLFLGRLDRKKGPDILVEALSRLKMTEVYGVFAGPDDDFEVHLRSLVQGLGLSGRVVFTGLLQEREVKAAYAAADVFALPSRYDTFPMALVEACASGLPIVTTDTNQVAELIKGRAGLVARPSADSIAEGLENILGNPDLKMRFSIGARELAESHFSLATIVNQLESIYGEVLSEVRKS